MSSENDLYDRTVRELLTDHVERGVPESTNLWPGIERRLALREEPAEQHAARRPFEWLLGAAVWARPDARRAGEGRARGYAPALAGAVGLIVLALVATLAIAGLAQHPAKNPVGTQKPSPVATGRPSGQMISLVPDGDGFR